MKATDVCVAVPRKRRDLPYVPSFRLFALRALVPARRHSRRALSAARGNAAQALRFAPLAVMPCI
ncbi:MAG: hypothetical protein U1F26_13470 [Lysobacterales bacterium]